MRNDIVVLKYDIVVLKMETLSESMEYMRLTEVHHDRRQSFSG